MLLAGILGMAGALLDWLKGLEGELMEGAMFDFEGREGRRKEETECIRTEHPLVSTAVSIN